MKEKEGDDCYPYLVAYPALETAVLIAVRTNIHQYDHCHFLDPHVPSCLKTSRTYSYQITEVVLPTIPISIEASDTW